MLKFKSLRHIITDVYMWGAIDNDRSFIITLNENPKSPENQQYVASYQDLGQRTTMIGIYKSMVDAELACLGHVKK